MDNLNGHNYVVRGRSKGSGDRPPQAWEEDCSHFVFGRTEGIGRRISPRPALGADLVAGLRRIARERRITHATFKTLTYDLSYLLSFLDWLDVAGKKNQNSRPSVLFNSGVEDLPGAVWGLFEAWLPKQIEGDTLSRVYTQCARVARSAAQEKFGDLPGSFILAPNRFPQRKGSANWDRTDDVDEDEDYRIIGEALITSLRNTTSRIAEGRYLLPEEVSHPPKDGMPKAVDKVGEVIDPELADVRERRRVEYAYLWRELEVSRKFPKTAILQVSPPAFIDRYPNDVTQDDFLSPAPGGRAMFPIAVEYRTEIISSVLRGDLDLGKKGADISGVPLHALRQEGKILSAAGWVDHIYHNQKKQYLRANNSTKEALSQCYSHRNGLNADRLGMREQYRLLHLAIPTKQELQCAFALFLLRTGFNSSTGLSIVPGRWHKPHPIHGENGTYVDIYAVKNRPVGKLQSTQSSTNKDFTAYDVMRRVIAWTEPLRLMIANRIQAIESTIQDKSNGISAQERMDLRRTLPRLRDLMSRAWLVVQDDGSIAELEIDWPTLNAALAEAGVKRANGQPVKLSQGLTRRAWAIFAYERSGANLILTKIALGHSDFASLITYIANEKRRSAHRRSWLDLGGALLRQFQTGESTTPAIIRELISNGRLTEEQGARLATGTSISAQGMQCADPRKPDPHIDPSHRTGDMCTVQNCYDGCSRAYPTFDTAIYVAREISRLEQLKSSIDIVAWTASDYSDRLEAAEELFRQYAPKVQADAIKEVSARPPRPMFGTASVGARRMANRSSATE